MERELPGRRLFVAVPLPDAVGSEVAELVGRVRERLHARHPAEAAGGRPIREVRWVRMDGLHLTLRFLGPTLDDRLPVLRSLVEAVGRTTHPFDVTLAGSGAFPDPRRPRALWLGLTDGREALTALAGSLDGALADAGWPPSERPFAPHLTLARADGVPSGAETGALLAECAAGFTPSWTVDRLVLFESHTGGGPARYEPLAEAVLAA